MMLSKRGSLGDMTLFMPYLFLMIVILVGIVSGIVIFFGEGYNFKYAEANAIADKVEECFSSKHFILDFSNLEDELRKTCLMDIGIFNDANLILRVCLDSNNCISDRNPIFTIGANFQSCGFDGSKENSAFPICASRSFFINDKKIDIVAGSNQKLRRISL